MDNLNEVDLTRLNLPQIQHEKVVERKSSLAARVLKCALPFLVMYRPAEMATSLVLGGLQTVSYLGQAKQQHGTERLKSSARAAGAAGLTAISLVHGRLAILLSLSHQIVMNSTGMVKNRDDKQAVAKHVGAVFRDLLIITSGIFPRADLSLLLVSSSALMELYKARKDLKDKNVPEAICHLLLAFVRAYAAVPYIDPARREWFGKDLTQQELDRMLHDQWHSQSEKIEFNELLAKNNYRPRMEGLHFEDWMSNKPMVFRQLTLSKCHFEDSSLKASRFIDSTIDGCHFSNVHMIDSLFQRTVIRNSEFTNVGFNRSSFDQVTISDSRFAGVDFGESGLRNVSFIRSALPNSSFFRTNVFDSSFKDCDLTDTLLFRSQDSFKIQGGIPPHVTKPAVGVLWDVDHPATFAGYQKAAVKDVGGIDFNISYNLQEIDKVKLEQEIVAGLDRLNGDPGEHLSLPQALIAEAVPGSELAKVRDYGAEAVAGLHGMILPGGNADINPILYGQQPGWATDVEGDMLRSMVEASIYRASELEQKPLMGICRGNQAIAVNAGAVLKQHVDGHWNMLHHLHPARDASPEVREQIQQIIQGDTLLSPSYHHQAVTEVPDGFIELFRHGEVVKMMVSEDSRVIGLQVHPETYTTWEGRGSAYAVAHDCNSLNHPVGDGACNPLDEFSQVLEPYDPEQWENMRERNRNIFTYFVAQAEQHRIPLDATDHTLQVA